MRKLGMIGGMSWVSTRDYYERINRQIQRRVSPMCSAPLIIDSLNFCELSRLTGAEDWNNAADTLADSARKLEQAGATAIIICANSMHKVYDKVQAAVSVPIIHIADVVADAMQAKGVDRAALIGTRNVMTEGFYRERLVTHGITLVNVEADRVAEIDRIIYEELMIGKATREAERTLKSYLTDIAKGDVDGVVLGCTELAMVIDVDANVAPIFDGTRIHADAAVEWILDTGSAEGSASA